ncbi:hypothetical protein Leryth_022679 [Lithospermum erythrorhizon]|nr:hypothetical protein Leryth_022679 [Lithospermum erythrorhizon]
MKRCRDDSSGQSTIMGGSNVRRLTTTDALTYLQLVKDVFRDKKDKYEEFLEVMKDFKAQRIDTHVVIRRVKQLFVGHQHLILGFNTFIPKGCQITLTPEEGGPLLAKKQVQIDDAFSFVGKIKAKLQGDNHVFKSFLHILSMYKMENKSVSEVYQEVSELFRDHPDLLSEFTLFLPYDSVAATIRDSQADIREQGYDERNLNHNGVQHVFCNRKSSADQFHQFGDGTENNVKLDDHEKERGAQHKDNDGSEQHRYLQKSIQELDLSNFSQRTSIGAEVLNDHWVSVTSGSEDYSFKHMRKNQYEESLFRCEDDRFEMDMLLESVTSTIKHVEELLDEINDNAIGTDPLIRIEDHFTALNLRCIERLYGDHGLDVIDVLRKSSPLALPVILTRLKQKQEDWARCRSEFNKVWAETYSKNYHKSLDHRSFYFKQQDTKTLSTKALLAEIKEICDGQKQLRKKDAVLSIAVESRQPVIPHMEFEYPDSDIHEDIYQLIKYSCGELCSSELLDKVMKIWTTFFELVLGIPSRPQECAEDTHDVDKDNSAHNSVGEENFGSNCTTIANHNPSNISVNRDDHTTTEHSTPSRVCLGNGIDGPPHPRDSAYIDEEKSQNLCQTPEDEKLAGTNVLNESSVIGKQATLGEQLTNSSTARVGNVSGPSATMVSFDINVERGLNMHISDGSKVPVCIRSMPSSSERVKEGPEVQECHSRSMSDIKAEKEEGELSPNEDTGLDNNVAYYGSAQAHMINGHYKTPHGDGIPGNTGEHVRGGENASQYAKFSPGAEDCSPEDPDEDADHEEEENKVESECEDGVEDPHNVEADGALMPLSDSFLHSVRPLTRHVPVELKDMDKDSQIFYGNDSSYLLFRLHQTLYERLRKAKLYSSSAKNGWRVSNDMNPTDSYARFINALQSLLDGSSDNARFEDDCRSIIGTHSYILFTLEKLIYKLVKQLQAIATDDVEMRLIQLYAYEKSRNPTGFSDVVYHANAHLLLPEGSNIYRIECSGTPLRLSIQLMDHELDKPEGAAVNMNPNFADYLYGDVLCSDVPEEEKRGMYLKRNKRKNSHGDADNALFEVMEGVIMINGLESRIKVRTSKVAYAAGSRDFMFRTRKRRRTFYLHTSSISPLSNVIYRFNDPSDMQAQQKIELYQTRLDVLLCFL